MSKHIHKFVVALSTGAGHVTTTAPGAAAFRAGAMAVELSALTDAAKGAPKRIKILPVGAFASVDGRPGNLDGVSAKAWVLSPERAAELAAALVGRKQQMLVDYEHQTLRVEKNGLPNPAAAWIGALEYLPDGPNGAGLYGSVNWTAKAADLVARGEYLYLSPVFHFDPDTGEVLALLHIALTNTPGLNTDALPELQAQLSALGNKFSPSLVFPPDEGNFPNPPQENPMKLLLAALGLSAVASEEAGLTALTALQSQVAGKDALIVELRAKQFDPAQHIPLSEHQKVADALAALSTQTEKTEAEQLMTAMLADSRILPVNADYWKAQPLAALKAFAATAKPLAAALGSTQTNGKPPAGGDAHTAALSAEEQLVATQLGMSAEAFAKAKAAGV